MYYPPTNDYSIRNRLSVQIKTQDEASGVQPQDVSILLRVQQENGKYGGNDITTGTAKYRSGVNGVQTLSLIHI